MVDSDNHNIPWATKPSLGATGYESKFRTLVSPTSFGWENSVLIFSSMTAAVIFAMGLYNAPAFNEAVSSAKKVKSLF